MKIKITTSDLRLCNWLYYTEETKFPMQVSALGKGWVQLNFEGNEGDVFENTDKEIYPIPLNKELLENIGFKYSSNHVYEYKGDENILFDEPDDWNDTKYYPTQIVGVNGNYLGYMLQGEAVIRCLYVHQLQNFFYCITGKELEIRRGWL
jgi:hypothetical protein